MMSLQARRELIASVWARYHQADRTHKSRILDEFTAATGYNRKYAICLLAKAPLARPEQAKRDRAPRPGRKRRYGADVHKALLVLWKASNHLCSKRLTPFLPELAAALERHHELTLAQSTRDKLLTLSPATCDRLLKDERERARPARGLATTKPGTLLKHQVPVRTFADWNESERRPGFCEVDLVAHCGDSAAGEYLHSLTLTDLFTGWTECVPVANRGQIAVCAAIETARGRLPFALLGLDSDNGAEFLNGHLLRYCRANQITFTRCRPYTKNDQCHVEQKNWTVVRHWTGYSRFEVAQKPETGQAALQQMSHLYRLLRQYVNFFQPSVKLISKERAGTSGARVKKRYDPARTPYQRVQEAAPEQVPEGAKQCLIKQYEALNPVVLLRQLHEAKARLEQHAKRLTSV